jgi:uncharacterized protein (TIGR03663 family)
MRRLRRLARPLPALVAVAVLALVARLWALGWRVTHQDEARVADWILHYMNVGAWEYYPMIHGPFLPHVNSIVFQVLGPSDFTARLVVAVVGALLPLSAWLFREHLRDAEVVALGLFLAANPLLLYYSRFMRNDVPTAAFMFVALGLFVRFHDTRDARYIYAGTFAFALGFTPKELALLYPFYWLGAAALLLDHRLSVAAVSRDGLRANLPPWLDRQVGSARRAVERLRANAAAAARGERASVPPVAYPRRLATVAGVVAILGVAALASLSPAYNVVAAVTVALVAVVAAYAPYGRELALAAGEFAAVFVFFYAPRASNPHDVGLFNVLHDPGTFPDVVEAATWGVYQSFLDRWSASAAGHSYLEYLATFWADIETGALALFVLAVVGFLVDRYTGDGPRDLVAFTAYWGFASLLTYPVIAENSFPWEMVHVVVPLAVPAAVGLAAIYRRGRTAFAADDQQAAAAAVVLLLLVAGQVGATAYDTSFERAQHPDNELVQYAQPAGQMQPTLSEIRRLSAANEGTDVLYYGEELYMDPTDEWEGTSFAPVGWFSRLPLPWYFHAADVETASTTDEAVAAGTDAPVVVTRDAYGIEGPLRERGYRMVTYHQYLTGGDLIFFLRS